MVGPKNTSPLVGAPCTIILGEYSYPLRVDHMGMEKFSLSQSLH